MTKSIFVIALSLLAGLVSAGEVTEQALSLETPTGVLFGTITFDGAAPDKTVALLISGSGPTDRDGNSNVPGIKPATQKLLAAELASLGITTLRVDKRGIGASAAAASTEADLRFSTYSDDAKAWVTKLKTLTDTRCIWIIGHSEGALIAEKAAESNADICGLVLMAGAGRPAGSLLREQLAPKLPPALKDQAFSILATLETGKTVAEVPQALAGVFHPSVQPYLISYLELDPAAILTKLKLPTLIMQGETDIQVSTRDAEIMAAAKPDAQLILLPGVNHIFKLAPADRSANIATYADPTMPLAFGVSSKIAEFILGNAHNK